MPPVVGVRIFSGTTHCEENLHTDKLAGLKGLNMLSRLKSLDIDSIHFIIAIVYQMHCIPEKSVV